MASSKVDKWKQMSVVQSSKPSVESTSKTEVFKSLAVVPELTDNNDPSKSSNDPIQTSDENSTKINESENGQKKEVQDLTLKNNNENDLEPSNSLTKKVNKYVEDKVLNKINKEDTHKKTSYFITYTNLAKLENFDAAHGGRIKGEFINNLLEEAFAELEEDDLWKEILNKDIDLIENRLRNGRRIY